MEVESEVFLNDNFEKLLLDSDNELPLVESSDDEAALLVASNYNEDSEYSDEDDYDNDNGWKEEIVARPSYPRISVAIADEVKLLKEPLEFYELFTEKVWDLLVIETNRYAKQKGVNGWINTDLDEIRRFFGLCLKMGHVKMPRLRDYWDISGELTPTPVAGSVMTRTRFETLLVNLHLADNTIADGKDRLFKIAPIISILNDQSEKFFTPGSSLCVDESLVPFRGRIVFRQYIPNKRHRYGIKLFKICGDGGYTCRTKVYAGKEACQNTSVSEKVVLELADKYLDVGRDIYTDNYYTGIPLGEKLIARKTNLIGTCRRNRKGLPKTLLQKKLKRGDKVAYQKNGIMVLKYKDKRDILMLSTRHDDTHDGETQKPRVIEDYNRGKMYVDISDQMCSYTPFSNDKA
ncbi:hypothetical protein FO519_009923 [Halicephalobus sp. NKZ332]|nr:hypothetical protein FO519_009923 [Halicephalobus sp. NKZ332]